MTDPLASEPITPRTTMADKMAEITQGDLNELKIRAAKRMAAINEIKAILGSTAKPKKKLKDISKSIEGYDG